MFPPLGPVRIHGVNMHFKDLPGKPFRRMRLMYVEGDLNTIMRKLQGLSRQPLKRAVALRILSSTTRTVLRTSPLMSGALRECSASSKACPVLVSSVNINMNGLFTWKRIADSLPYTRATRDALMVCALLAPPMPVPSTLQNGITAVQRRGIQCGYRVRSPTSHLIAEFIGRPGIPLHVKYYLARKSLEAHLVQIQEYNASWMDELHLNTPESSYPLPTYDFGFTRSAKNATPHTTLRTTPQTTPRTGPLNSHKQNNLKRLDGFNFDIRRLPFRN